MMLVSCGQSDVQCILKLLGYKQHVRTSGGSRQAEGFGNDVPSSLLSSGEEVLSATNISDTLNPASSPRGVVNTRLEPLAREFASVNSATSSSTDAAGPTTKETNCHTEPGNVSAKQGLPSMKKYSEFFVEICTNVIRKIIINIV
jgi:hypothetical protein